LEKRILDLPFKVGDRSTIVVNDIPVLQCHQCGDIELEDPVMARVEEMLKTVREGARLEVIQFAA